MIHSALHQIAPQLRFSGSDERLVSQQQKENFGAVGGPHAADEQSPAGHLKQARDEDERWPLCPGVLLMEAEARRYLCTGMIREPEATQHENDRDAYRIEHRESRPVNPREGQPAHHRRCQRRVRVVAEREASCEDCDGRGDRRQHEVLQRAKVSERKRLAR